MAAKVTNGSGIVTVNTGSARSITGGNGVDTIDASTLFTAGGTSYKISGGNGADVVNGSNFAETIWGDDDSDTSANGADTLNGGGGNDIIHGGNGADRIAGDAGADELWGDRGGDTFVYKLVGDSSASGGAWTSATGDTIKDFATGDDTIDLAALNAFLTGAGPTRLTWTGSTAAAHGVWFSGGILYADIDGNSTADLAVKVTGTVGAMDFVGVNHGPTAGNDSIVAVEKNSYAPYSGDLKTNDGDVDGDTLSYSATGPLPAGFTLNPNGTWSFDTSIAAYTALKQGEAFPIAPITIKVSDPYGAFTTSTLSITLTGTNDAPTVSGALSTTVSEDAASTSLNLLTGAADVDHDAVLNVTDYLVVGGNAVGVIRSGNTVAIDTSAYQYLQSGENAQILLSFNVSDELGATATQTATITITGVNDRPVTADDTAATTENAIVSKDVLTNDSDVDDLNATLQIGIANTRGAHGLGYVSPGSTAINGLSVGSDGRSLVFNPDAYTDPSTGKTGFDWLAVGQTTTVLIDYNAVDPHGANSSGGTPTYSTLVVTITGTNDGPVASATTAGVLEDATTAGTLMAVDPDSDAATTFAIVGTAPTGFTLADAASGAWTFDASSYDSLAKDETATFVIDFTATDSHGASSASTLTITVTGTNDTPTVSGAIAATLSEDDAPLTVNLLTGAADIDHGAVLHATGYMITSGNGAGLTLVGDSVTVDTAAYQYLQGGSSEVVTVSYSVTDEFGASAAQTATITITGVNDRPVTADDTAATTENAIVSKDVLTNDSDVDDLNATLQIGIANTRGAHGLGYVSPGSTAINGLSVGSDGRSLVFNPDAYTDPLTGKTGFDWLAAGQTTTVLIDYNAVDPHGANSSGGTPTYSTLVVTITGTNDVPVITSVAQAGTVTEDGTLTASGAVTATDADQGAVLSYSGSTTDTYGSFTVASGGGWTYVLDNAAHQNLAQGEVHTNIFTVTVTDDKGATTTQAVTITVAGANDAPTALGDTGTATEDAIATGSVAGNDGDVDAGASLTYALTSIAAGLSMTSAGVWTLNAGNAAYQSLGAGQTTTVNATYLVTDQFGASATAALAILVTGVNDPAVIGGTATGAVTEDAPINTATGTLSVSDADSGQASFQPATATGVYGSFAVTAAGVWTYTLNNADTDLNTLNTGQQATENFTVLSADGTAKLVSITVNGANEGPTLPTAYTASADPNDFDSMGSAAGTTVNGDGGNNTLYGGAGDDNVDGKNGNDTIYAGSGNDAVTGNNDNDTLYGGSGRDTMTGANGDDVLIGGYGADTLTGSNGADIFRYLSVRDTNDTILDFSHAEGDKIDVHALGFTSIANASVFTANNQLIWYTDGANTIVLGNTDGDASTAEFMITISNPGGAPVLVPGDFIL